MSVVEGCNFIFGFVWGIRRHKIHEWHPQSQLLWLVQLYYKGIIEGVCDGCVRRTSDVKERQGPSRKLGSHLSDHFNLGRPRMHEGDSEAWMYIWTDRNILYCRWTCWHIRRLSKHNKTKDQVTCLVTNPGLRLVTTSVVSHPRVWDCHDFLPGRWTFAGSRFF